MCAFKLFDFMTKEIHIAHGTRDLKKKTKIIEILELELDRGKLKTSQRNTQSNKNKTSNHHNHHNK